MAVKESNLEQVHRHCLASRLFISPPVLSSRMAESDPYQGAAVTLDLLPLLGFTAVTKAHKPDG